MPSAPVAPTGKSRTVPWRSVTNACAAVGRTGTTPPTGASAVGADWPGSVAGALAASAPPAPTRYCRTVLSSGLATQAPCVVPSTRRAAAPVPAGAVAAAAGVSVPSLPIEYCETVLSPGLTAHAYLPAGSTTGEVAPVPAATVAVEAGVSVPSLPSEYCEIVFPTALVT